MFFLLFINTSIYLCAIYDLLITLCECGPYRDGWKFIFFCFKIIFYILKLFWCIVGMIIFGSVRFLSKKITKPNFFKKTETASNWPVSVWFFGQKPVQTGLARFFPVLARFFRFRFGSGWFLFSFLFKYI